MKRTNWRRRLDVALATVAMLTIEVTVGRAAATGTTPATQAEHLDGSTLIGLAIVIVIGYLLVRRLSGESPRHESIRKQLSGKAFVTDGDGVRVCGQEVRFANLDAPEWDQPAKHADGYWFRHGRHVKRALSRKIGGKDIVVDIEEYDKFGRAVGTVTCNGEDIGAWLVREGHAIACYGRRYKSIEQEAKAARKGMWSHAVNIDPRQWRHKRARGFQIPRRKIRAIVRLMLR